MRSDAGRWHAFADLFRDRKPGTNTAKAWRHCKVSCFRRVGSEFALAGGIGESMPPTAPRLLARGPQAGPILEGIAHRSIGSVLVGGHPGQLALLGVGRV